MNILNEYERIYLAALTTGEPVRVEFASEAAANDWRFQCYNWKKKDKRVNRTDRFRTVSLYLRAPEGETEKRLIIIVRDDRSHLVPELARVQPSEAKITLGDGSRSLDEVEVPTTEGLVPTDPAGKVLLPPAAAPALPPDADEFLNEITRDLEQKRAAESGGDGNG